MLTIVAILLKSAVKVDSSEFTESDVGKCARRASARNILAASAGTRQPIWARYTMSSVYKYDRYIYNII